MCFSLHVDSQLTTVCASVVQALSNSIWALAHLKSRGMEVDALRHPDLMRFLTELAGAAARALVRPHATLAPPGSNGEPRLPECQRYLALVERDFSCQVGICNTLLVEEVAQTVRSGQVTCHVTLFQGRGREVDTCSGYIERGGVCRAKLFFMSGVLLIGVAFLHAAAVSATGSGQHRVVVCHAAGCGLLPAASNTAAVCAHPQRIPCAATLHCRDP